MVLLLQERISTQIYILIDPPKNPLARYYRSGFLFAMAVFVFLLHTPGTSFA